MEFIKSTLGFFKKGSEEAQKPAESAASRATLAHPDLGPNGFYALPNAYAPVMISSQGISCRVEYQSRGEYLVTTQSKGRLLSEESLNARDRKKRIVSSFAFKGLVGVHLHPAGMVLALDEEKNFRGEARHNQPPATIVSGPVPPNDDQLRAGRIMTIDLNTLSEERPMLIAPNTRLLHMMVKPLGEGWGVYISNISGIIRPNSPPVTVLKREGSLVVDRKFLVGLSSLPEGRILGGVWNVEIVDPIMMRLAVDGNGLLTLEELFTINGLSVVVGNEQPVRLGLLGDGFSPQESELRDQFAQTLGKLRDRTLSHVAEQGQEEKLQEVRDHLIADVAHAIQKESDNGVVMLALELAVKESVVPLYNEASGSERITAVDHDMVNLLNAIVNELSGWIQTDSSIALSAAVIRQMIHEIAHDLPMENLGGMMQQALPKTQANAPEEEQVQFEDLYKNARPFLTRFLTASPISREVQHLARQVTKANTEEEQKASHADLDQAVQKMMRETMIQTLIRLGVRSHLLRIEQEKREELGFVLQKSSASPVTNSTLDEIIKRYNEYARYMDPAFQARLKDPLNSAIRDFQTGAANEQSATINTKGFVTYMAMLRQSGGKIEADSDATAPAITALHAIPDAIPDIHVEQPDRGVAKGVIRVVHREGPLLEASFTPMAHADKLPPGVPGPLWFLFYEFSVHFMAFNLTGDFNHTANKKQIDLIAQPFTKMVLLKVVNLFRGLKSLPSANDFTGTLELLGEANGMAEMRLGEDTADEVLDLKNRPAGMKEAAMDLKHELRQIVVLLQKDGKVSSEIFRLKQRMRAFATAGGGGAQKVALPITITARRGLVTIEAGFDDQPFKKSARLMGEEGESTEKPTEEKPAPAAEIKKKPISDAEKARILAVREQTKKLSQQGISQLLNGVEFFKDFSTYEKNRVSEFDVSFQLVKQQEVIIRENTHDTAFFIVIKGRVAAIKGNLDAGNAKILFNLKTGDMIGELAFLTGMPRTLNIVAQENGLLLRVDHELMSRLGCESREKFKDQIINKLVQRLADTTTRIRKTARDDRPDPLLKTAQEGSVANPGEMKQLSREETNERIDRIPFFGQFSTDEKRRITAFNTSFHTYPVDTYVIHEGDMDTAFFILIDGAVTVIKGKTEIVDLGPGEFFGDMAFLTSMPRTTGVRSKSDILVLRVDQDLLKRLGPEIREKIKDRFIRTLSERLVQTTGLMV